MDNKEMIQNFGDMVEATERMSKPWQEELKSQKKHSLILMLATNLFWMIIVGMLIVFAYIPVETTTSYSQNQNQDTMDGEAYSQSQSNDYQSTTSGN